MKREYLFQKNITDKYTFIVEETNAKSIVDFIVYTRDKKNKKYPIKVVKSIFRKVTAKV